MQSGLLPGGGVAFYQASKVLESGLAHLCEDESERQGVLLMAKALKMPMRKVIENKIGKDAGFIIHKIEESGNLFTGFDA